MKQSEKMKSKQRSDALPSSEPIRLHERDSYIGLLQDIIEQEDFVLAVFVGALVEMPKEFASDLLTMVGQRATVGLFGGKYRIGKSTL